MKHTVKLLALLLIAALTLGLCACGDSATGKGGDGADTGATEQESIWMRDAEYLRANGYNASLTRSDLYKFEDVIHAEKNAIAALVTATNETEGIVIMIYYLKTEEQAAACMKGLDANHFKQVGVRVVHGDRDNVIR